MKGKFAACVVLIALSLLMTGVAVAEDEMPWTLTNLLYGTTYGYSATVSYAQAGDFIVSERENGDWRGLAVFTEHDGGWRVDFLNGHAMKHGAYVSELNAQESPAQISWQYELDGVAERFVFEGVRDLGGAYDWRLREYSRTSEAGGRWTLTALDDTHMLWRTQALSPGEESPVTRTFEGALQNDLRTFKLDSFPTDDARLALALVDVPHEGEYTLSIQGEWMECKRDKQYPVLTGPGEQYMRAASGKALVSTADSIFVYGEENGFLLIHYRIDNDRLRIGYIPVEALAYEEVLEKLNFVHAPARIVEACELTDDPIVSQACLTELSGDSAVAYLSLYLEEWAYVETETAEGIPVRGFVKRENLSFD